jgi:hypothetical protein
MAGGTSDHPLNILGSLLLARHLHTWVFRIEKFFPSILAPSFNEYYK